MFMNTAIAEAIVYTDFERTQVTIVQQVFKGIGKTRTGSIIKRNEEIKRYINNPYVKSVEIMNDVTTQY